MALENAPDLSPHLLATRHDPGRGYVWRCSCGVKGRCGEQEAVAVLGSAHVPAGIDVYVSAEARVSTWTDYRRYGADQ